MNKKIVFGCILAVLMLVYTPCVSSLITQAPRLDNKKSTNYEKQWARPTAFIELPQVDDLTITVLGKEKNPEDLKPYRIYLNVKISGTCRQPELGTNFACSILGGLSIMLLMLSPIQLSEDIIYKLPGTYWFVNDAYFEIKMSTMMKADLWYDVGITCFGINVRISQ
jgi:hypothetical protein